MVQGRRRHEQMMGWMHNARKERGRAYVMACTRVIVLRRRFELAQVQLGFLLTGRWH